MPTILTAQQHVYSYLFDRIIAGHYPGGTHLKTEDLAAKLQISRMPVREALRQLHAEGLVVIKPNRGAFVTSLTTDDILELFEMGAALEGLASRIATGLMTVQDLDRLQKILAQMDNQKDNPNSWIKRHDEFHTSISEIANRPRLSRQIKLFRDQTRPYVRLYINTHEDPEVAGLEHRQLLAALQKGDPKGAEDAMRSHMERNGEVIAAYLEQASARDHGR